jgi:hypothetical protein
MNREETCGDRWWFVISLAAAFATIWIATACEKEEVTAPCLSCEVGAFEGRVLAGGLGVPAVVGARVARGSNRGAVLFLTTADSTGHYRLAVPSGSYWLEVNVQGGLGAYSIPGTGDTLIVTNRVRTVDIRCASVTARVRAPMSMEGRVVSARLARSRSYESTRDTVRNGQLEFRFPPERVATSTLVFETGSGSELWYPGTTDRDSAEVVTLPTDRPLVLDLSMERWGSFSGTLAECPSSSHKVEAYGATDSVRIGATRVSGNGDFQLDVLSARPIKLRVESEEIERWLGGDSFGSAHVFDLHPGEVVGDLAVGGGTLRCLLQGPGHQLFPQARLSLCDEAGRIQRQSYSHSDAITLCNLRPGSYRLYVTGIGAETDWGSQWYDGATSLAQATPIDVREGEVSTATFLLRPGGALEGCLRTNDDTPLDYGAVSITDVDRAGAATYWIQRRDEGKFRFEGLGDGRYLLWTPTASGAWWYPGTATSDSARTIEMVEHGTATGIEWRLP